MNLIRRIKMTYCNKFVASVKSNGKILREVDNRVILPFQTEYSILLKNLDSGKASVSISIDGQDVLYGKSLILNPNTTIELERFVDNLNQGNKFRLTKKTQEISDYRGDKIDDGVVRVAYKFEKYKQEIPNYPNYPNYPFYTQVTYCISNPANNYASTPNIGHATCSSARVNSTSLDSNTITLTSLNSGDVLNCSVSSKVEDGITVQGSKSEQQFNRGYIGELEEAEYVIILGLKGSDKIDSPITVKTTFKCPTCGKFSKEKFCGNCGTNLELY